MDEIIKKIQEKVPNIDSLKIEILIQKCLNYMNRTDFPDALVLVLVERLLNDAKNINNEGIKSVTEGDTKIEYVTSSETDNLLESLRPQLNRFRKVGVI